MAKLKLPGSLLPVQQRPEPLSIHFVPVYRRPSIAGWILLVVGIALAGLEVAGILAARAELAERHAIVAALRAERPVVNSTALVSAPLSSDELQAVRRVSHRLDADWGGIFAALGRVRDNDVAWVEVEILGLAEGARGDGGSLRLTGMARSLEAVLSVTERVRKDESFVRAELVSHEVVTGPGGSAVRFTLSTQWGRAG